MKKLIVILSLCFMLSGCFETFCKNTAGITEKVVHIDPRVLEECSELPKLTNPDQLLETNLLHMELYRACALKQKNSIKLLKEFANVK